MALTDEGRRSGKEARNTENREQICCEFPALEDALAPVRCQQIISMRRHG